MKIPLTQSDLTRQLDRQIYFLKASCDAFDAGFEDEAYRLATTIRVLVHDTKASHSLLEQLGQKDGKYLDSAFPFDPDNLLSHSGLVFTALGPPRSRYVAMLDDTPFKKSVDFNSWWTGPVFKDTKGNLLSRSDIVLKAANQDGGAHVDPGLDAIYHDLTRENSLGWMVSDGQGERPMDGPERAAIRQIAHEMLKSLDAAYAKMPNHQAGVLTSGMVFKEASADEAVSKALAPSVKMRRNELCFCGSGKKFKKCHGSHAQESGGQR